MYVVHKPYCYRFKCIPAVIAINNCFSSAHYFVSGLNFNRNVIISMILPIILSGFAIKRSGAFFISNPDISGHIELLRVQRCGQKKEKGTKPECVALHNESVTDAKLN